MVAITRPGSSGYGVRLTSSFAGKTLSENGGHPVGVITRSGSAGHGVRRVGSFAGKLTSGVGGRSVGVITRASSSGYGTRRCSSFTGKVPSGPAVFTDFPQPNGTARQASLPRRATAQVTATSETVRVLLSDPKVFAKTRLVAATDTINVRGSDITAKAGFRTALIPVSAKSKTGTILASGRHDLSDEELITMFLELLD